MANGNATQNNVWMGFLAGGMFILAGVLSLVSATRHGKSVIAGAVLILVGLFWAVIAAGWKRKASQ